MFKRFKAILTAICCMFVALAFVACGNKGGGNTGVAYTITVVDQNDNGVSGVDLQIFSGETEVVTGRTDNTGKFTGKLQAGDYVIVLDVPVGYETDATEISFSLSATNSTVTVDVQSSYGSESNPIWFAYGETGVNTYNIPADTTYYFIVPRSRGGTMTFTGKNLQVIYKGNNQFVEEGKTVSITLDGQLGDTFTYTEFAVRNGAGTASSITMTYIALEEEEI